MSAATAAVSFWPSVYSVLLLCLVGRWKVSCFSNLHVCPVFIFIAASLTNGNQTKVGSWEKEMLFEYDIEYEDIVYLFITIIIAQVNKVGNL